MGSGLSTDEARRIADALWQIEWITGDDGYMTCPGVERHTKTNGPRDCRIMLEGGKPPTIHCVHSSCESETRAANFRLRSALGKAEKNKGWVPPEKSWSPPASERPREEPPSYDREKLEGFAGEYGRTVDLSWLANRSPRDPSLISSDQFLDCLYWRERGERVIVFTRQFSQGEAVWPHEKLPDRGKEGVWFLAQPVDGQFRPNPRVGKKGDEPKMSRRSAESVSEWRFMVVESDEAPARLWLGALVQLPLRVAAIYTSGGKSVHALVKVGARVQSEWEAEKNALLAGLLTLGADRKSLSGVRLTRLPGCWRNGTVKDDKYIRYEKPQFQKLLYLDPEPPARPIAEMLPRRDVIDTVLKAAAQISVRMATVTIADLEAMRYRAWYFSPVSEQCQRVVADIDELIPFLRKKGRK